MTNKTFEDFKNGKRDLEREIFKLVKNFELLYKVEVIEILSTRDCLSTIGTSNIYLSVKI